MLMSATQCVMLAGVLPEMIELRFLKRPRIYPSVSCHLKLFLFSFVFVSAFSLSLKIDCVLLSIVAYLFRLMVRSGLSYRVGLHVIGRMS